MILCATARPPISAELGRAEFRELPGDLFPKGVNINVGGPLPDGRVVWGALDRVLIFDGDRMDSVPLPANAGQLTGLNCTPDGRILISAANYAGVATEDALNGWNLSGWLQFRTTIGEFKHGFSLIERDGQLIVLHRFEGAWFDGSQWNPWPDLADNQVGAEIEMYFTTDQSVYRLTESTTLHRWVGHSWQLDRILSSALPDTSEAVFENAAGDLTVATDSGSLIAISVDGELTEVSIAPSDADRDFKVAWFPDGAAVVKADNSSIRVQDRRGRVTARIDESSGSPVGDVRSLFIESPSRVWLPMGQSAASLEWPAHLTRFDRSVGLESSQVLAITRYRNQLYVGTNGGVYRLLPGSVSDAGDGARFERVPGINSRTPTLLIHQDQLLAGHRSGVSRLEDDQFILINSTDAPVSSVTDSPFDPERIYLATTGGARSLRKTPEGWVPGEANAFRSDINDILEFAPNAWLLKSGRNKLLRFQEHFEQLEISIPAVTASLSLIPMRLPLFGQFSVPIQQSLIGDDGLPSSEISFTRWGESPLIVTELGLFSTAVQPQALRLLDPDTQATLRRDRRLGLFVPQSATRAWVALSPTGEAARQGLGWQVRQVERAGTAPPRILPSATTEVGKINAIWCDTINDESAVLWVGGDNGLIRLHLPDLPPPSPPRAPRLLPLGDQTRTGDHYELTDRNGLLAWSFTSTSSTVAPLHYRTRLISQGTGDWTRFQPVPHRELGFLSAGRYQFEAQARNADGLVSPISAVHFTIPPPWWLKPGSLTLFTCVLVGLFIALMQWLLRQQHIRQAKLESLVAARTGELHANERQLSLAKQEAEAANQAKSTFLASMSHELRTPLNVILGFAHLLQRETQLSPKGRNQLQIIDRNGQHLLTTINEVLDISKIEANAISLQPTPCTLPRLLSDLTDFLEPRAVEKHLNLNVELGPDLPRRVMVDVPRLRQVLINLLSNAIKFTEQGEVTLRCIAAPVPGRIRFEVSDTGPGIPLAQHELIFRPFHQTHSARRQSGTGLGLAISQRLIELMGGRIQLASTPGAGSAFAFDLALPPAGADSHDPFVARDVTGYRGPRRRLLIVDDEATNQELIVELLTPLGFVVNTATNAAAAETRLRSEPIDAVLLDIRMPGENGLEFVRRYRSDHPADAPPFIAVSASAFDADRHEAINAGCRDFLAKPIAVQTLIETLGEHLSLEWLTGQSAPKPVELPANELPRPRPDLTQTLLTLARAGDLSALRRQLVAATDLDPRTAAHLDGLARDFNTSALREWLAAPPSPSQP